MAGLQQRLDAAFGALGGGGEAPAWKPSQQQIFRSGAPVNGGNSSDEEYEERQRRETMPGAKAYRTDGQRAGAGSGLTLATWLASPEGGHTCLLRFFHALQGWPSR